MFVDEKVRKKVMKEREEKKKEKKQKLEERLKEHKKMDKKKKHTTDVPTMAAKGGRAKLWHGGPHNTGRMNLLEQEGRIRAEPQTRNVRAEEARVRSELNRGYKGGKRVSKAHGGGIAQRGLGRAFLNAKKA